MPSLPFQSFEASRGGNLRRTQIRAGKLSPIGDERRRSHINSFLFMLPRWTPAIPLATTDLSCRRSVKDLTCRPYAADEMMTHDAFGHDPATPHALNAYGRRFVVPRIAATLSSHLGASRLGGRK
jgi:hypothetical protein